MKKYITLGLYILLVSINATHTNNTFGKTHFIVGYPTDQNDEKEATINPPLTNNKVHSTKTCFTTVHDVRKELEICIKNAKKSISIATFTLTDTKIANLLVDAHRSGISVTIITDRETMKDKYSKIEKLAHYGIPVFYYTHELNPNHRQKRAKNAHMHHKFMIIDDETLIFGSLNLTKAGQEENIENITITKKPYVIADYREEFKRLLSLSTKIRPSRTSSKI